MSGDATVPAARLDAPPETLDDDPSLGTIMTSHLVGITPDAPVRTALQAMAAREVRHLPVIDDGRCVGLVTEPDLLRGMVAEHGPLGATTVRVHEVAGRAVVLGERTRLSAAAARMAERHVDAVLVGSVDRLVGIVTTTDVVRVWSRHSGPAGATHD
ncbi:CBS domain-containing protein [Pseudonocardia endophytica]|uniref:CBS domain-containing protein n=1 Tax=Pseudonocardia endophytica TaxID=401976 RepID=A0A4R1HJV2_PSEEN|nr:CBS domain-containing protein [Pseudonocardia endophytica]TCK22138.1 CBS domain-containing protein [Pseudonocardia endophytica]